MNKRSISKWQKASDDISQVGYDIEDILNRFTPEEKESLRYKSLVKSIDTSTDNAITHATGKAPRRKFAWLSWQTAAVVLGSPLAVEIFRWIQNILSGGGV